MTTRLAAYLARYAECRQLAAEVTAELNNQRFQHVLIVPAYDETSDAAAAVKPPDCSNTLVISVVNAPDAAPADARTRTLAALPSPGAAWHLRSLARDCALLTLDAVTQPLPAARATGLARKMGNDLACALIDAGIVTSPWLHNSDADARLPAGHFERAASTHAGAVIAPFRHRVTAPQSEHTLTQAGALYELYMRYVADQIHRSGSPYGYPALGSVLSVDAAAYAAVRGFPQRSAAEDFYLLNKLAKLKPVVYAIGAPVSVEARESLRVPFGTGPALARLRPLLATGSAADYGVYAQQSFAALAQFQRGCRALDADASRWPQAWLDPDVAYVLKRLGFPAAFERLQSTHRASHRLRRAVAEWFDAGKTIRFLNECRHFHPDEPLITQFDGDDYDAHNAALEADRGETLHGIPAFYPD